MPWCEPCGRFYTPSTLTRGGDCPEGHHVADPDEGGLEQSSAAGADDGADSERVRAPWHFWLMLAALAVYLGWRLVQGIAALVS
jgi:hypothetical protein